MVMPLRAVTWPFELSCAHGLTRGVELVLGKEPEVLVSRLTLGLTTRRERGGTGTVMGDGSEDVAVEE